MTTVLLVLSLLLGATDAPEPPPCPGLDYPAVLSLYDPALGGVNCDGDCSTVATGPLEEWMYESAGACPAEFTGGTVHFPTVDFSMDCVDKGPAITAQWSDRDNQCVVYFDVLWHLPDEDNDGRVDRNENGVIEGIPYWSYWFIEDWTVTFDSGYHLDPSTWSEDPVPEQPAEPEQYPWPFLVDYSDWQIVQPPIWGYPFASTLWVVDPLAAFLEAVPY